MDAPVDPGKTYPVPPEVMVAVSTGRAGMLSPLKARIASGDEPTTEEWLGVCEMMADIISDRNQAKAELAEERERLVADLEVSLRDTTRRFERIVANVRQSLADVAGG